MVDISGNLFLDFRSDLNILICRFTQPIPSSFLRQEYENSLEVSREYNARYWLFDLRRRGPISAEDESWILDYFFPQAENLTRTHQYFAYLVTPSHYLHIKSMISVENLANFTPLTHIAIFDSENKALDWLALKQINTYKA